MTPSHSVVVVAVKALLKNPDISSFPRRNHKLCSEDAVHVHLYAQLYLCRVLTLEPYMSNKLLTEDMFPILY